MDVVIGVDFPSASQPNTLRENPLKCSSGYQIHELKCTDWEVSQSETSHTVENLHIDECFEDKFAL